MDQVLRCEACGAGLSAEDVACQACGAEVWPSAVTSAGTTAAGDADAVAGAREAGAGAGEASSGEGEGHSGDAAADEAHSGAGADATAPTAGTSSGGSSSILGRYRLAPSSALGVDLARHDQPRTENPPPDPMVEIEPDAAVEPEPVLQPIPTSPAAQVGHPSQTVDTGQRLTGPILAVAGVALLLVATVVALSALLSPQTGPAGAGVGASASSSAVPSVQPSAVATASPSVDPGIAIRDAFFKKVQDPNLSYRVAMTGLVRGYGDPFHWSGSIDVSGDDFGGTIDSTQTGSVGKIEVRKIEDVYWLKAARKPWIDERSADPRLTFTPFLDLAAPRDLDYAGPTKLNGKSLHLLKATTWYQPDRMTVGNFSTVGLPIDDIELQVYVTSDGTPVSAVLELKSGAAFGFSIVSRATYDYSRFGQKVTISEPSHSS